MNGKLPPPVLLTNDQIEGIYNMIKGPTSQELKELLAALMWTTGLQDDIDKFLEKYPHLRP